MSVARFLVTAAVVGAVGACGLRTAGTLATASLTEGDAATADAASDGSGTTSGNVEGGSADSGSVDGATLSSDAGDAGSLAYRSAVLADAPIAFYRLGEATGAVAYPEPGSAAQTGSYATCTLGTAGALAGDSNTAVSFNGATSMLSLQDQFDFTNGDAFTIELWANPPSLNGTYENLFLKESSPSGIRQGYGLIVDASGAYKVERFVDGTQASVLATSKASTHVFTYLVMIYDGTNLTLYVDGIMQGQSPSAATAPSQPTQEVTVGSGAGYPFAGVIDEIAIYDHVLADTRITAHYKAATSP